MSKKFLNSAYHLDCAEQTKQLYQDWAATYDQELESQGYASPRRAAEALAACGADLSAPVLDIGCGSGVSGECLNALGFSDLYGSDFSPEMLAQAQTKNIYTKLHLADFSAPFDFIDKPFTLMTAVGVFSVGHAEPSVLRTTLGLMPAGGLFAFSLNDHALQDPAYLASIQEHILTKKVRIRWQEYGDHVPGIGLSSMIIVLERIVSC